MGKLSGEEFTNRLALKEEYIYKVREEEIKWRRIQMQMDQGDKNNKFFNGLQKDLSYIVPPAQGPFVQGRQILYEVLMGNENIHPRARQGHSSLVCKPDFEKAYDKADWGFLLYLLQRMGFGPKWRGWMDGVSYARFSAIINGSPKGFFLA